MPDRLRDLLDKCYGTTAVLRGQLERAEAKATHHAAMHLRLMTWLRTHHPAVFSEALKLDTKPEGES